jgi:hypothetical protein
MESSSGKFFFRVNQDVPYPEQQRFCYRKIVREDPAQTETDYPIYLTIRRYNVSFDCSIHHAKGSNTSLAPDTVNKIYSVEKIIQFSFGLDYTNSIQTWLQKTNNISTDILDPNFYRLDKNFIEAATCFSSIAQLLQKSSLSESQELLSYQELALDFLFDLFHSNVFNSIPNIDRLKNALLSHSLSMAILNKYNFFFHEKTLEQKTQFGDHKKYHRSLNLKEEKFLTENLENSAKSWLNYLRTEDAGKIVCPSLVNEVPWFEGLEEEHEAVYARAGKYINSEHEASGKWLVSRYKIIDAFWSHLRPAFFPCGNKVLLIVSLCFCIWAWFMFFGINIVNEYSYCWPEYLVSIFFGIFLIPPIAIFLERFISILFAPIFEGLAKRIGQKLNVKHSIEADAGECLSPPDRVLLSTPSLVELFMPKALISGFIVLFSLWEFLDKDYTQSNLENFFCHWTLFLGILVALIFCCGAFVISKIYPMLQVKHPREKFYLMMSRVSPIFLFLFSVCFFISLLFGLTEINLNQAEAREYIGINIYKIPQSKENIGKYLIQVSAYIRLSFILAMIGATAGIIVEFSTSKAIKSAVGLGE